MSRWVALLSVLASLLAAGLAACQREKSNSSKERDWDADHEQEAGERAAHISSCSYQFADCATGQPPDLFINNFWAPGTGISWRNPYELWEIPFSSIAALKELHQHQIGGIPKDVNAIAVQGEDLIYTNGEGIWRSQSGHGSILLQRRRSFFGGLAATPNYVIWSECVREDQCAVWGMEGPNGHRRKFADDVADWALRAFGDHLVFLQFSQRQWHWQHVTLGSHKRIRIATTCGCGNAFLLDSNAHLFATTDEGGLCVASMDGRESRHVQFPYTLNSLLVADDRVYWAGGSGGSDTDTLSDIGYYDWNENRVTVLARGETFIVGMAQYQEHLFWLDEVGRLRQMHLGLGTICTAAKGPIFPAWGLLNSESRLYWLGRDGVYSYPLPPLYPALP